MTATKLPSSLPRRRRIFILDDHPMTRYGIVRLIEQEPDLVCCGEAENARSALDALQKARPELVLADLTMPDGEGMEFLKKMRELHPDIMVLVLSMHDEELYAERALRAGARGYVMKNEGGGKLVEAIREVLQGKIHLSKKMAVKVTEIFSMRRRRSGGVAPGSLTDREFEVFRLLGHGLTTREIAERLHLGIKTVETHRLHMREKLGLKTGPALIQYAVRWVGSQDFL